MYRESTNILVVEGTLMMGLVLGWKVFNLEWLLFALCVFFILMAFTLYFFRDPERRVPRGEGFIVSPADGRVVHVAELSSIPFFEGRAKVVTIYLSFWDVHINRVPISGEVTFLNYQSGRFHPAFQPQASERNEHAIIGIEGKIGGVFVKQIAGMLARRIVCRLKIGDRVRQGERYGMIKFGSRVEVYLPSSVVLRVSEGDQMRGGESIIGVVHHEV